MSNNSTEALLDPFLISRWIADRQFIWQIRLVSSADLCSFVRDRGLNYWCLNDDIQRLWQIGLLRADLVIAQEPLKGEGLTLIKQNEEEEYLYADTRDCVQRSAGLGGVFGELEAFPANVNLMFHPFRYYVLQQIERNLEVRISRMQILSYPEGYLNLLENHVQSFNEQTAEEAFRDTVRRWNDVTSLAVAAEPFTFSKLFGSYSLNRYNRDEFLRTRKSHFEDYKRVLEAIGIERVTDVIGELCGEARMLEANKDIHRLLRFTKRKYRLERVKGELGGAVYLLTMAEMIRRSVEMVFKTELPEENEEDGFNEHFYGADRLNDDYKARGEFLRRLGLDHSVRVRWYVEGATELGALEGELAGDQAIELINLKGQVVAAHGKGLAFRENLLADMDRSVYSWISLDGDVEDSVRVLYTAVEKDEMFGMFFVSKPDFPFGNFTRDELVETLWQVALERGAQPDEKPALLQSTSTPSSENELFTMAKQALPSLQGFDKGKAWGVRLMQLARRSENKLQSDGSRKTRPIIEAVALARHTAECNYFLAWKECKVDKKTGRIVKKPKEDHNQPSKV